MGSERLGAGQHIARAKARAGCRTGRGAGRVQGQGTEGMQDFHFEVFKACKPQKSHFCNILKRKGKGGRVGWGSERLGEAQLTRGRAGQAGRRQGAGHRAQGQGTEGRVGLQDSILRFSRPENLKNNIFATLGQGQGLRAGQGRAQRAKQGCKIPENPKITVLQLFEERGRDRRAGHASLACPRSLGVLRVYGLRSYRLNLAPQEPQAVFWINLTSLISH